MTRWTARSCVASAALGMLAAQGCASTQPEERAAHEETVDAATMSEDQPAMELRDEGRKSAPTSGTAELDLDDYERELASVEAELRELGVVFKTDTLAELRSNIASSETSGGAGGNAGSGNEGAPSDSKASVGTGEVGPQTPRGQSRPTGLKDGARSKLEKSSIKNEDRDKAEGKKPNKKKATEAKAAQRPQEEPDDRADPVDPSDSVIGGTGRCASICDLGQVTCGLSDSICELAERHQDEDDYRAACERAVSDCDVAEDACHVCSP